MQQEASGACCGSITDYGVVLARGFLAVIISGRQIVNFWNKEFCKMRAELSA